MIVDQIPTYVWWMVAGGAVFWIATTVTQSVKRNAKKAVTSSAEFVPIVLALVGVFALITYVMEW